jgi:hypothetical protein
VCKHIARRISADVSTKSKSHLNLNLQKMGDDDRKRAIDAFAWSLNIFASVAIVMVNKQLMGGQGFGFSFGESDLPSLCPPLDRDQRAASFPFLFFRPASFSPSNSFLTRM